MSSSTALISVEPRISSVHRQNQQHKHPGRIRDFALVGRDLKYTLTSRGARSQQREAQFHFERKATFFGGSPTAVCDGHPFVC